MFHYVLFGLCKFQTVGSAEIYKNPMIVLLGQTMFFLKNAYSKVKDKGTHETKAHMARAYPGFHYFPLDGMPVHHGVTPQQYVAGTHLYTLVKRDKVE